MKPADEQTLLRFHAYVEDEMSDAERAAFEQELDHDAEMREQFDDFVETLAVLARIGDEEVPEVDLRSGVERKIRKRSRGRFFGPKSDYRQRMQAQTFLALAVLFLIGVVAVISPSALGPLQEVEGSGEFEPESDRPTDGSAAHNLPQDPGQLAVPAFEAREVGRTSEAPIAAIRHEIHAYTLVTNRDPAVVGDRIRDQFRGRVIETSDGFDISIPRSDAADIVTQFGDWGAISRANVPAGGDRSTTVFRIRYAPQQP